MKITLLYYTSVWAVVSTLMVYVVRQFHFGPVKVCMYFICVTDTSSGYMYCCSAVLYIYFFVFFRVVPVGHGKEMLVNLSFVSLARVLL